MPLSINRAVHNSSIISLVLLLKKDIDDVIFGTDSSKVFVVSLCSYQSWLTVDLRAQYTTPPHASSLVCSLMTESWWGWCASLSTMRSYWPSENTASPIVAHPVCLPWGYRLWCLVARWEGALLTALASLLATVWTHCCYYNGNYYIIFYCITYDYYDNILLYYYCISILCLLLCYYHCYIFGTSNLCCDIQNTDTY